MSALDIIGALAWLLAMTAVIGFVLGVSDRDRFHRGGDQYVPPRPPPPPDRR